MTNIRLLNLSKHYGSGASATRAVDDVTLDIRQGEFFFLLGPSGCGKTTLLRMLAGLLTPTAGKVFFGDRDVTDLSPEKRNTAMVFQNYALWPHMTVRQNVEFAPKMQGRSRPQRREACEKNLALVQMEDFVSRKPNQLSGGQQQRVALARALAANPDCLLLDEPLSNLDARLRSQMRDELRRLVKEAGATGVYVTHDQKEALAMADRVAVMHRGRVVQVAAPTQLYRRPASRFVADFLGEANFLDGTILAGGDTAKIQTPAGVLMADGSNAGAAGSGVTLCVRPENISIAPAGANRDASAVPGMVESAVYLGEICQYGVRLAHAALWKVSTLGNAPLLPVGQAVELRFDAHDATLLTE
jgi:iron(III) transport system ATP-binding protein